jgi:beta-xylosidase
MIQAVMIWNEPNNKSHWDLELDPDWSIFAEMVKVAADAAIREANPEPLTRARRHVTDRSGWVIVRMDEYGVLEQLDAIAVHGFPLDWNNWMIDEWPNRLREIQAVTDLPVWVTEVGISSLARRKCRSSDCAARRNYSCARVPRIHWYSLYDLPAAWPATTRHREAEGSSYYRHFHMGLLREDGTPKRALQHFSEFTPDMGICQWFHFEDHRLDDAVRWFRELGVKYIRTGLSWADSFRPNADAWFDRQMAALEEFDVTVTFCFTPEHRGITPHYTSAPAVPQEFADFCGQMTARYSLAATEAATP